MRLTLTPHPAFPAPAVTALEAELERDGASLAVRYRLTGDLAALRLPPRAAPERSDGLWRATCFEVFARPLTREGYGEVNLSPSTQWAAYRFVGYRDGMQPAPMGKPDITMTTSDGALELAATLDLGAVAGLAADAPWRVGLSAIVEATDGGFSYWALAHPAGRPDFHHADCFALELPAPERS